ncbi:MAG: hypothetical protein MUD14_10630 [Hydrococcus sp. Prado102]|jgi:hypothetical protein|nr:hypothetical protein [Hydrococcus sp. Prado102]
MKNKQWFELTNEQKVMYVDHLQRIKNDRIYRRNFKKSYTDEEINEFLEYVERKKRDTFLIVTTFAFLFLVALIGLLLPDPPEQYEYQESPPTTNYE